MVTDNAALGGAIDDLDIEVPIADDVAGIRRVTVTFDIGAGAVAFVEPTAIQFPILGTNVVA